MGGHNVAHNGNVVNTGTYLPVSKYTRGPSMMEAARYFGVTPRRSVLASLSADEARQQAMQKASATSAKGKPIIADPDAINSNAFSTSNSKLTSLADNIPTNAGTIPGESTLKTISKILS